jgi:hypothetical protein
MPGRVRKREACQFEVRFHTCKYVDADLLCPTDEVAQNRSASPDSPIRRAGVWSGLFRALLRSVLRKGVDYSVPPQSASVLPLFAGCGRCRAALISARTWEATCLLIRLAFDRIR